MIGKLKGLIEAIGAGHVLMDVGGVVYVVFASGKTLAALPGVGEAASLWIETHVREDHIHLYGFATQEEQAWFKLLTTVKGVGTKVATAIQSVLSPAQLHAALAAQDKRAFSQVSGVGPRLAERIVTELKGKAESMSALVSEESVIGAAPKKGRKGAGNEPGAVAEDAISALTNLGYNRTAAYQAVHKLLAQQQDVRLDELIKRGLKELAA